MQDDAVQIRLSLFPVVWILVDRNRITLLPFFEDDRPGADRFDTKSVPETFCRGGSDHESFPLREHAKQGWRGALEIDPHRIRIDSIDRRDRRTQQAFRRRIHFIVETPVYVPLDHLGIKSSAVMEPDPLTKRDGEDQAVFGDGP